MKVVTTFNPLSATSGSFSAGFTSGMRRIVVYNQSNVNLLLQWDAFTTYLPAWTVMLYCISTSNGNINWSQNGILQMFNSPVSQVTVELFENSEQIVGTFPAPVQHQSAVSLTGNTLATFSATFGVGSSVSSRQILNVFNPANSGITYTFHSARVFTNDNTIPTANLVLNSGADKNFGTAIPAVSHNGSASPLTSTANCTAVDGAGTAYTTTIEVLDMQQNVTQDFLLFPDSVALAPGNNLGIILNAGANGHIVRLTLKWTEGQAPAPLPPAASGAGLTAANQLIQLGQAIGTTLIQSVPSGQTGNAWFVTNDGLATLQTLIAGVYHQILKASASGSPLQLGQVGDITEVLGNLLVDGTFSTDGATITSNGAGALTVKGLIINTNSLQLLVGTLTRVSFFDASVTTVSSNFPHGLGVLPDLVLGINDGTTSTANPMKWSKGNSDATNAALVSTINGTFHCIAIKF